MVVVHMHHQKVVHMHHFDSNVVKPDDMILMELVVILTLGLIGSVDGFGNDCVLIALLCVRWKE